MRIRSASTFSTLWTIALLFAAYAVTAQTPRQTGTSRQIRTVLKRIETNTDIFRRDAQIIVASNTANGSDREERLTDLLDNFERSTDTMSSVFESRGVISGEITDLLNRATRIDRFMTRNRVTGRVATRWAGIKTDLNTLARYYNVTWNTTTVIDPVDPIPAYTATDAELRSLLAQIENKTDTYKQQMERSLDRSVLDNTNSEDSWNAFISKFEAATDRLKDRYDSRKSTGADATEVLERARGIDRFMGSTRMNRNAERQWSSLRNDLNTLATYYRVSWNWNQQYPGPINGGGGSAIDSRMTGTFRLNRGRSDNVTTVIDRSIGVVTANERDRTRRQLERRLASPEVIAIEKSGRTVSIGSSNSPQVTFEADGVARTETNQRGRTVTTTATADRDGIVINYEGDRIDDFYVMFAAGRNDQLTVTRRVYLADRNETVTVTSIYDKANTTAQWPAVTTGSGYGNNTQGSIGDFYIPNGTHLTARLRNTINTRASQVGDRFAMEVTSPGQFQGATIEGRVVEASGSGRITGRANISLDLDTLRMNGRTYRFAGIIDSVVAANGDSVTVNNEGTVRDGNRTTQTATRAGIGAVLGAVIGAIAGGGSGAAIGAGIGAGAGAGTVLIAGRDNIDLTPGSTFTITASAPTSVAGPIR